MQKIKGLILGLFLIWFSLSVNCQTDCVLPKHESFLPYAGVDFVWNIHVDAISYEIEISRDIDFSDIYYTSTGVLSNNIYKSCIEYRQYFWRIRCFDGSDNSVWSPIYSFVIYKPESISEPCVFRLNADSVYHTAGNVDTLYNYVGDSFYAYQDIATSQPTVISNELNSYPVIRFDGDDYLNGDGLVGDATRYSFFIVCKATEFANHRWIYQNSPFGTQSSFSITAAAGSNYRFWPRGGTSTGAYNYETIGNSTEFFQLSIVNDNSLSLNKAKLFNSGLVDGISNTNTLTHSDVGYKIGTYNIGSNYFKGDIAEIILYDTVLNDISRFLVDNYLRYKYFPDDYISVVDLGEDIKVTDSFCDTALIAYEDFFVTYDWSTGETDSIIHVNEQGTYSVTATDVYGFSSIDTIQVVFPEINHLSDTTICDGAVLTWDTELLGAYTYQWLNSSSTDTFLDILAEGEYAVTVEDTYGCSYFSDTIDVSIDVISINDSLGIDRSVCSGETLSLYGFSGIIDEYEWSTLEITSSIIITSSDEYILTVTSNYGCTDSDTVNLTIKGEAPNVDFETDTVCSGFITSFADLTTIVAPDDFESWDWDFGSGNISDQQNPSFLFDSYGDYSVSLTVVSDSGCISSSVKNVVVKQNPVADFLVNHGNEQCAGHEISFVNNSEPTAIIFEFEWKLDEVSFSSEESPITTIETSGSYEIELIVSADNGCKDSINTSLLVSTEMFLPDTANLVSPVNNFQFYEEQEVDFSWNEVEDIIYFQFEISKFQDFSDILYSEQTTLTDLMFFVPDSSAYFWRVLSFNLCDDFVTSDTYEFAYSIVDTTRIVRWFDAGFDLSIVSGNLIESWTDKRTLEVFNQDLEAECPALDTISAINEQRVARFDGIDDNFIIDTETAVGHIFTVCNYNSDLSSFPDYKGIINSAVTASKNYILLSANDSDLMYTGGSNLFGDNIAVNQQLTMSMSPLNRFKTINGFIITPESYESLQIGGSRNNSTRFWDGNIAEIIVYDTVLSETEQSNVYQYLRHKYSPPVNLLYDIRIPYGFCDTAITTAYKPWFTSYEWSTGETDSIIHVNKPGLYTVTVTDIFGFESSDDIRVFYPEVNTLTDTLVCFGELIEWNTELSEPADYTYEWYGSVETTEAITISTTGEYAAIIEDINGCKYYTDTINFGIDNYEYTASIGPEDTLLCAGNRLLLIENNEETANYNWSTGSTDSEITITETGEYSVSVTSNRGCEAVDTINVTINGVVPVPLFASLGHCAQNPIDFTDLSTSSGGTINTWVWSIDGTEFSTSQNPTLDPITLEGWLSGAEAPLVLSLNLAIETDDGCGDFITQDLTIYPLPVISFTPDLVCANSEIEFTSTSTVGGGSVVYNSWEFYPTDTEALEVGVGENVIHTFTTEGTHTIQLISTSDAGCTDSIQQEVYVKPASLPVFSTQNTCLGEEVYFINETEYNPVSPVQSQEWDFGDGSSTGSETSPLHIYEPAGIYDVTLSIRYTNGCELSSVLPVEIYYKPEIEIDNLNACVGINYIPNTEVSTQSGTISTYEWQIGDPVIYESSLSEPEILLDAAGEYPFNLIVENDLGCSAFLLDTIIVRENPLAAFSASRNWGAIPLWIDFTNTSIGAESYSWQFDEVSFSIEENPYFVFQDSGTYVVQLSSFDEYGCFDTEIMTIKSVVPLMDIILYSLRTQVIDNYLTTSVYIINNGTLPVEELNLDLNLGNGQIYRETIENFESSQVLDYTFTFKAYLADGNLPEVVCVEAVDPVYGIYSDIDLTNNTVCNTNVENLIVFQPWPNPASDYITCEFILANTDDIQLTLINSIGEIVYKTQFANHIGYKKHLIDISDLSQGVYFLQIRTSEEQQNFKLEVNR